MIGETINRKYLLESVLSRGPTGTVYLASSLPGGEPASIKFIESLSNVDQSSLFQKTKSDFERLQALNHPGFSRAFDYGLHDGKPYLVSSYHEESPLTGEIELAPLPMERALHICHETGQFLSELHSLGLVHGDLRPENVLLKPTRDLPFIRLVGYGFTWAMVLQAEDEEELDYFAPEQIQGQQADVGTDLYSLGGILYALTTGHRPSPAEELVQASKVPGQLNILIPVSLENLILDLLDANRSARPDSTDSVLTELGRIWENDLFGPGEYRGWDEPQVPGPPSWES